MALATTDMWIEASALRLFAESPDLHTALECRRQRASHFGTQDHEFAGVGAGDGWDRAGATQVTGPGSSGGGEQAAIFLLATAIIVAIEIFTFHSGWCTHQQFGVTVTLISGSGEIGTSASVHADGIALVDKVRHLDLEAGFGFDLFDHTCGGITSHRSLGGDYLQIN